MKKSFFLIVALACFSSMYGQYAAKVNPFVGTDEHGHTYPGAVAPFGMVQLSPDTRLSGWDGCSGYHYSDTVIYGFSHTHLSGTGVEDLCDILFSPTLMDESVEDYTHKFSHSDEQAYAGFYSVKFSDGIACKLTALPRVGYHLYSYPSQAANMAVIVDMFHRDKTLEWDVDVIDSNTIVGYRNSRSWAEEQRVYFATKFSKKIAYYYLDKNKGRLYVSFQRNSDSDTVLQARTALSSVSCVGALKNLGSTEVSDFYQALEQSRILWDKALGIVDVEGGTKEQQRTFYTSLYHCLISPNLYSDVDGKYRGMNREKIEGIRPVNNIFEASGYNRYTIFSLWDTYRALTPLMSILYPDLCKDWALTFKDMYLQMGELPMWELHSWETHCMIGAHGVSALAEWILKGIVEPDETCLQAMIETLNKDERGMQYFHKYAYIPSDMEHESVSKTVEYCYNMYCVAMVAKKMGKTDIYEQYIRKAQYYKNLFNPENTFLQPKDNERFMPNFDPRQVDINYTEGSGWHYTFYVPQDMNTLIEMMGGEKKFDKKLDACFFSKEGNTGRKQADITGIIGQYSHGNEPSQHMSYLYNYVGKPYKTQKLVRQILNTLYSDKPDGVCGNDDCGQMAAWYVMSAMGFYPVNPSSCQYIIGSPLFDKVTVHLSNGKDFVVRSKQGKNTPYVKSLKLNGKPYEKSYIDHKDILEGCTLDFEMSSTPNKSWGEKKSSRPHNEIEEKIDVLPYISYKGTGTFNKNLSVQIYKQDSLYRPHLQADFLVDKTTEKDSVVKLYDSKDDIDFSYSFRKIPSNRSIKLLTPYSSQYTGGGDNALIDTKRGGNNWKLGAFQGYWGENVEAVVDLGSVQYVEQVGGNFIQDERSWIFMPLRVEYYISNDGKNFKLADCVQNTIDERTPGTFTHTFSSKIKTETRYIKMKAYNRMYNPEWHLSKGEKSWLFIDEIIIEP